jgi:hypothetical protein
VRRLAAKPIPAQVPQIGKLVRGEEVGNFVRQHIPARTPILDSPEVAPSATAMTRTKPQPALPRLADEEVEATTKVL